MKDAKKILSTLSSSLNGYESTCWLKAENDLLNGATPAEMMIQGKSAQVAKILPKEIKRIKSKKNNG